MDIFLFSKEIMSKFYSEKIGPLGILSTFFKAYAFFVWIILKHDTKRRFYIEDE